MRYASRFVLNLLTSTLLVCVSGAVSPDGSSLRRVRREAVALDVGAHGELSELFDNFTLAPIVADEGFLTEMRNSGKPLCSTVQPSLFHAAHLLGAGSQGSSVEAMQYELPQEPACQKDRPAEMAVLHAPALTFSSEADSPILELACADSNVKLDDVLAPETKFPVHHFSPVQDHGIGCNATVAEDTILFLSPREEVFGNVYHNLEAVFAVLQTADVLMRPVSDFRILFMYPGEAKGGFATLLQLSAQISENVENPHPPLKFIPQLLEVFNGLVRGKGKTFRPLPSSLPRAGKLCFQQLLVLPMRECAGSILTATWQSGFGMHRANAMANRYGRLIAEGYDCRPRSGKIIQLMMRQHSGHGRRAQASAVDELLGRLPKELDAEVNSQGFSELPMSEQICHARRARLMIGIHGAGLSFIMYMPEQSGLVEITPYPVGILPFSVANIFYNLAEWTNHKYRHVLSVETGDYATFDVSTVIDAAKELL
mmetsp:Transcript_46424/g.85016  ORF Transcript_46424/g.85016 Transcript_46424/m.85016 type:complete len:484 (-) Transcript_46424:47-1498(-)